MYLKIVNSSEVKTASNGNEYQVVEFQELSEYVKLPIGTVEVKSNAKPGKRTLWNGQDGLFGSIKQDDVTFGTIKRFDVAEYVITADDGTDRKVSTFTGVQFRGETDDTTCRRYGHELKATSAVSSEALANQKAATEATVEARTITA